MPAHCPARPLHRLLIVIPALFGLVTILAALAVLLGIRTPAHAVFRPLLLFNGVMGLAYLGTALALRWNPPLGRWLADGVALANLGMLGFIFLLQQGGYPIAADSLRAMAFRTAVWAGIAFGVWHLLRTTRPEDTPARGGCCGSAA